MSANPQKTSHPRTARRFSAGFSAALRALRGGPGVVVGLVVLIWAGLPLIPAGTGLRFGTGYQLLFTTFVLAAALFFWFLGKDHIPQPRSPAAVLVSVVAVYLLTVGFLVTVGMTYPQFKLPRPPEAAHEEAAERGKVLFWHPDVGLGCFRCHAVAGKGGTRAPDLAGVASRAGERVPGLTAEQYITEKIKAGSTYEFKVPEYTPMMPPFGRTVSDEQVADLVAYLLSLEKEEGE